MPSLSDIWGNTLEVTPSYVAHRSRLIDVHLIHTFQAKGKRLLINTFKQNEMVPTMCIFFESKEKALEAYELMKTVYYGKHSSDGSSIVLGIAVSCFLIPVLAALYSSR